MTPPKLDLPRAADLPGWMAEIRDRYLATETGQFVLHGNVHDLVFCANQIWSMPEFLDAFFAPSNKVVVHFDPGRGIWFPNTDHAARAATALAAESFISLGKLAPRGVDKASKEQLARRLNEELEREQTPQVALQVLEALLARPGLPVAVILHYAELIAPDGPPAGLNFEDRTASARLHRWSLSDRIAGGNNIVLMLTSGLSQLARRITRNPRVGTIQVPLPESISRARFLAKVQPGLGPDQGESLTRITAGLQLRQIQDLISPRAKAPVSAAPPQNARALFAGPTALPVAAIAQRKKEILEQECYGLIEVIEPEHDFTHVGGMEPIKKALMRVAGHVKAGRRRQVPMGILLVGPMGTGKSFLAEAFAKESGLAAVRLKNFRDRWVGSTEANLEKVLSVIEGLGEILVMIDEGDRSIGGGDNSTSDVNSRVMARLKEFMSDTSHRGRIIFMMMTNRPDKLDTDMKRPGRFDMKIPFFPPQTAQVRAEMIHAVLRRNKIEAELPDEALLPLLEDLEGYAAADLEAIVLLAFDDMRSGYLPEGVEASDILTVPLIAQAIADFMPTREVDMIRFMELLAVHEASNRRLLPPQWREIQTQDLNTQLAEARRKLRL